MTHERHGRSTLHTNGKLMDTLSSNDAPHSDGPSEKHGNEENDSLQEVIS